MSTLVISSEIGKSRYLPEGANAISTYACGGAENLSLAQLMMAVEIARAAQAERLCVVYSNVLATGSDALSELSAAGQKLLDGTLDNAGWIALKAKLISLGATASDLPNAINTYDTRMQAYEVLQTKLTELTKSVDQTSIALQTATSKRDVAFNSATTVVKNIINTSLMTAAKMK